MLLYNLQYGSAHANAIKRSLPHEAVQPDDAPILFDGLTFPYNAFNALSSERAIGFGGVGPIPWSAVNDYAKRYRLTLDEFELLLFYVEKMDAAFIDWQTSQANK